MPANLGLFEKNLSKISADVVSQFGMQSDLVRFLEEVANSGNVYRAAEDSKISALSIARVVNDDRYLSKCVSMAKRVAVEKAESVLYERAINGYEEITYGRDGESVLRKHKYCSKSLMEYLKANNAKYQVKAGSDKDSQASSVGISMGDIEVESYANYE